MKSLLPALILGLSTLPSAAQTVQKQNDGYSYCYRMDGTLRCSPEPPVGIPADQVRKIRYSFLETKWVPPIYRCGSGQKAQYTRTPAIGCVVIGFDTTE